MYTCIIVDDELEAIAALQDELQSLNNIVTLVGTSLNISDAITLINKHHPSIVFLDIRLKEGSGFDLLERVTYKDFHCIFVTAYDKYAIQAFRANAVDYLLKPVHIDELTTAVEKVRNRSYEKMSAQIQALLKQVQQVDRKRITITTSEGFHVLYIDEIVRCSSDNNYSIVFTIQGDQLYSSKTLKELEMLLDHSGFERIHQSHLINLQMVKKYLNKDGGILVMQDGTRLPVSRRKKNILMERFNMTGLTGF